MSSRRRVRQRSTPSPPGCVSLAWPSYGQPAPVSRRMDEDPGYAAAMAMPKLLAYIEANPAVNIEITGTGSNRSLVFSPTPATRFQIVKLLDDDYLRSVLTDRDYEAGSKIRAGHNLSLIHISE